MLIKLGLNDQPDQPQAPSEAVSAKDLEDALRDLVSAVSCQSAAPQVPETPAATVESLGTGVPAAVTHAVDYWINNFGRSPADATRNLNELSAKNPELTARALVMRYEAGDCGEATSVVASLLARNAHAFGTLCDTTRALEGAISMAQSLATQEPRFDAHFAKNLLVDDQITEGALERGLKILEQLPSCGRLIPILIQFLRSSNGRVRSKAALTLGRIAPARSLTQRLMRDADDRVRANFVEGLWKLPANHVELFREALQDPHHRVVGNALVGLHFAGHSRVVTQHVAGMVRRPEAAFRAAAAWVMGQTGEERYAAVLRGLLRDPDWRVRRGALIALRRIKSSQSGTPPVNTAN
ncbi:MAG TPA: HEAT repeat domain-containing protein [Bryobacteraceae bacterium]|nr:HEAT repeat domain-containing protein [Bryobacteraceae bacterium]